MLQCTIKFCGGCNPRHDLGEAYRHIRQSLADVATFSLPEANVKYDALVILRGCTGCEYVYENIQAAHRLIATRAEDVDGIIRQIRTLSQSQHTKD